MVHLHEVQKSEKPKSPKVRKSKSLCLNDFLTLGLHDSATSL